MSRPGDWAKLKVRVQVKFVIITSTSEYETKFDLDIATSKIHTELLSRMWIQVVVFLYFLSVKI